MLSKWSHQNIFAHFLVLTRPKRLLISNKRKRVKIGQNAFTLNQGDTPLVDALNQRFVLAGSKLASKIEQNVNDDPLQHIDNEPNTMRLSPVDNNYVSEALSN